LRASCCLRPRSTRLRLAPLPQASLKKHSLSFRCFFTRLRSAHGCITNSPYNSYK
jgi:hypothetical protein